MAVDETALRPTGAGASQPATRAKAAKKAGAKARTAASTTGKASGKASGTASGTASGKAVAKTAKMAPKAATKTADKAKRAGGAVRDSTRKVAGTAKAVVAARSGLVENAKEAAEAADLGDGVAASAIAQVEELHYQVEVNRRGFSANRLSTTLNQRWDNGWRLAHILEQRGNTVLVFEKRD